MRDVLSMSFFKNQTLGTGTINSSPLSVDRMRGYCVVGKFIEVGNIGSCKVNLAGSLDDITYVDIVDSTLSVSKTLDYMWNIAAPFYRHVRMEIDIPGSGKLLTSAEARVVEL